MPAGVAALAGPHRKAAHKSGRADTVQARLTHLCSKLAVRSESSWPSSPGSEPDLIPYPQSDTGHNRRSRKCRSRPERALKLSVQCLSTRAPNGTSGISHLPGV